MDWVKRVPRPPVEDIVKSAIGISTEGYTHQLHFSYPKKGGIEGLLQSIVKKTGQITPNFPIREIQRKGKEWHVAGGNIRRKFDKLVLCMPVTEAIKCMENVP